MLMLIGDPNDLTSAYLGWLARRRGLEPAVFPEDRFGVDWWGSVDEALRVVEIVRDGRGIDIATIQGAFIRFNPEPALPPGWELGGAATELFVQERRAAISAMLEALPVATVNRPSAGRSNGSKPLHMAHLARAGLRVPAWLAASDPVAIRAFLEECPNGAVVKAASGLRSHVRLVDAEYLQRVQAGTTPSVIQRYVPGQEVRVHVVGPQVFGSRVEASVVDYRFDTGDAKYHPCGVPDTVSRLCVRAAARDGLALAGLDFRVDEYGRWWCLEMNPVPTFLPYEASTGHPIGDAILDLMLGIEGAAATLSPLSTFIAQAAGAAALTP